MTRQFRAQGRPAAPKATVGKPRYLDMVERHFVVKLRSGDEIMAACPWHTNTGSPSLQINVRTGLYVCFNPTCNASGGPKKLAAYCGELLYDAEADVADISARLNALQVQAGHDEDVMDVLPETMLKRYQFPTDYWDNRGFTKVTQQAFDLGWDALNGRPTIALRNIKGELIGFLKRSMDPDDPVKYRNPKGYKKSHELFGSWFASHSQASTLVVVEGPTDCIKVWQAGFCCVAQYGAQISPMQVRLIRRMGFTEVVKFYDNDSAGRRASKAANGLKVHMRSGKLIEEYDPLIDLRRDFLVREANYHDFRGKDPGALESLEIIMAITTAKSALDE